VHLKKKKMHDLTCTTSRGLKSSFGTNLFSGLANEQAETGNFHIENMLKGYFIYFLGVTLSKLV
jgi:hypothetical protein